MPIISRDRLRNFIKSPHIPFVLLAAIRKVSPTAARLLQYGRCNVNTEKYWNQRYESGDYDDERYGFLRHAVMKLIPEKTCVLDAGCGNGNFMELLRERRECVCMGVDISGVAVKMAQAKGFSAIKCKLPKLPPSIPDDHFDGCTILETLEHISRPGRTISALSRVVKEGGFIVVAVPDDCMRPEEFDEHVSAFTMHTLQNLIGRYFTVETTLRVKSYQAKYLIVRARKERRFQMSQSAE